MNDALVKSQREQAAYCPLEPLDHQPHLVGSCYCATCGARLEFGVKPHSGINSWAGWPDDVRDILRGWNKGKGLSFRGLPYIGCRRRVFRCEDCGLLCEGAGSGIAMLKDRALCDDCLIGRARETVAA